MMAMRSPGCRYFSASRAVRAICVRYRVILPLTSSRISNESWSVPCANATRFCGAPSSATTKSSLRRFRTRMSPCVTCRSTRTSETPVLNVGTADAGCETDWDGCPVTGATMNISAMKNVIVGTAGHIDHGKTALVRALTGIDTDRLKEEKERGISIDLGFAHLELAKDLRLGFVDVPGHERFIKNMLAGAGGIDLVLFVIAAEESIKPQTREHFDICRLLNIPKGIVVLTKADLVDPDILEIVRLEVDEFVADSFLEGAPIVAVSSTTGQGIPELLEELAKMAGAVAAKDASRYFRLPIDRSFSMRGFGAVITGTLISGGVRSEQEVEVHPGGTSVRVRGIQVHGETVQRASAGQRTALNLAGVDSGDVHRGLMLAEAGRFQTTTSIDCAFDLLPGAKPLKHRAPIHFHAHTAEVEGEVRGIGTTEAIKPGTR